MFNYKFSNLVGATYRGGGLIFSPDGNALISPVGNRISVVDLVHNRCLTLGVENRENIRMMAISPDSKLLLSVDVSGHALLINFVRGVVLTRINFKGKVNCVKFSPCGKYIAVAVGKKLDIWKTPTIAKAWAFHKVQDYANIAKLNHIDFSADSKYIVTAGMDMSVRIRSTEYEAGFKSVVLTDHAKPVRAAFWSEDHQKIVGVGRDGTMIIWAKEDEEWAMESRAYCKQPGSQDVTKCSYNAKSNLLVVGFSGGLFSLYEMPGLTTLHTLSVGNLPIDAVELNASGDWLALGVGETGQLLVWEWQSETYILKQQGHHYGINAVAFSPAGSATGGRMGEGGGNGTLLATGGHDGKVKLWNTQSGFCFVTFTEHTAPVTAVTFTPQANAVLSASYDGSVRAFDLLRYRNFRTFVSPNTKVQFTSLAVDNGGEIVAAGAQGDEYTVYVWSIQTGQCLEVLAGHEAPVHSLSFSPHPSRPGQLCSGSWDGFVSVWDIFGRRNKGGAAERLMHSSSVLSVAFDPRGNNELAASSLGGQITIWNVEDANVKGTIEGLRDIQSGRSKYQGYAANNSRSKNSVKGKSLGPNAGVNQNQHFSSIAYTASGQWILAGSRNSPYLCLYDTTGYNLAMRFTLTENRSLHGVMMFLNSKDMMEHGVSKSMLDLSDSEAETNDRLRDRRKADAKGPGVEFGDAADKMYAEEHHVWDVDFAMDGRTFAAASSHGLYVFSMDNGAQQVNVGQLYGTAMERFVPQMLTENVTTPAIMGALEAKQWGKAMVLALALNDFGLLVKVYESIPLADAPVVVSSIGAPLLPALLHFLGACLNPTIGTPHIQYHLTWLQGVIDYHIHTIMQMNEGNAAGFGQKQDMRTLFLYILQQVQDQHKSFGKPSRDNIFTLQYLGTKRGAVNDAEMEVEVAPEADTPAEESPVAEEQTATEEQVAEVETPVAMEEDEPNVVESPSPAPKAKGKKKRKTSDQTKAAKVEPVVAQKKVKKTKKKQPAA